jgi:hypothetical protein
MTALIFGLGILIVVILVLLASMVHDLVKTGFYVWHRNSVGHMLQYLLWTGCILSTVTDVRHFIGEYEEVGYQISGIGPSGEIVESKLRLS